MKKNKIAFVIPGLESGGAERVVSTLANELHNKYEISIITLWDVEPFYHLNKSVKHIKCTKRALISKNIFQAIKNNLYLLRKLNFIIKKNDFNLIIGFTSTANILTSIISKKNKIPCIISERSNPNIYTLNQLWRVLRNHSYKNVDYLVVQTKTNQSIFKKHTPINKVKVIPNPLSNELIKKKEKLSKKNIILNVGRLDKNKSQDLLIKAFSNVNNKNWQLVIVGDGIEKDNYINLVEKLGIKDQVLFTGNITNVFDYYNTSKIFAFTSKSEGFPNALVEAMYFNLPCISTDCPSGPSEVINDGQNGYLIPVNDQNSLELKLTVLMNSEKLRIQIGKNAHHTALSYEPKNIISQWETLINKALE